MTASLTLPFADRKSAGRLLARQLVDMKLTEPLVLALPRGGVPVGAEIAHALRAPLDLLLVRKIGAPHQPELAIAAVAEGQPPCIVLDEPMAAQCPVSGAWLDAALAEQMREMARRRKCYLSGEPRAAIAGRTVILTDDGIATGTTVRAALKALRQARVRRVILAVPVAPPDEIAALRGQVDRVVCLATPVPFGAVGAFYRDFHQLSDDEVVTLVQEAHATCRPDQVHPSSL